MKVMKSRIVMFLFLLLTCYSLCACGAQKQEETEVVDPETAYLDELEAGYYYIRHKNPENGYYEAYPLYFPTATFEAGSVSSSPSDNRIFWFKDEEYEKIPTMYPGDSLIYYYNGVLSESFTFERFEDLGYTIGLRGMTVSPSGRYNISTKTEDQCTFPNGDTDVILELNENETVKLDTLGGIKLRDSGGIYNEGSETSDSSSYLTRCGTIRQDLFEGKDKEYVAEIYKGTVRHEYSFKPDIRVLGSMEGYSSISYEFESEKIINIEIPEFFNNGYYLFNGQGLIRYLKDTNEFIEGTTEMNTPNERPEESKSGNSDFDAERFHSNTDQDNADEADKTSSISIQEENTYTVVVNASVPSSIDMASQPLMYIVLEDPSGGERYLEETEPNVYKLTFNASAGTYKLKYYDIGERKVTYSVGYAN